jgi:hypothetical protein
MSTTPTTHRAYGKPTDQGSSDVWGVELNDVIDAIDEDVHKLLTTAGYAVAGGTADVLTATLDPAPASYVEGMWCRIMITSDNTTSPTINLNALGAKDIKGSDGSTLTAGSLKANTTVLLAYDGTQFLLLDTPKATPAETLAGTSASKALTPAGLAGNKSLASDGYYKFPGGFMIQWGDTASIPADSAGNSVTFPTPFATACVHVSPTPTGSIGTVDAGSYYGFTVTARSTTGFTFTSDSPTGVYTWVAFGY